MATLAADRRLTVKVTILDKTYTLRASNTPQHTERVASFVDKRLRSLRDNFPELPLNKLAVLTAIQIADEHLSAEPTGDDETLDVRRRIHSLIDILDDHLGK